MEGTMILVVYHHHYYKVIIFFTSIVRIHCGIMLLVPLFGILRGDTGREACKVLTNLDCKMLWK